MAMVTHETCLQYGKCIAGESGTVDSLGIAQPDGWLSVNQGIYCAESWRALFVDQFAVLGVVSYRKAVLWASGITYSSHCAVYPWTACVTYAGQGNQLHCAFVGCLSDVAFIILAVAQCLIALAGNQLTTVSVGIVIQADGWAGLVSATAWMQCCLKTEQTVDVCKYLSFQFTGVAGNTGDGFITVAAA